MRCQILSIALLGAVEFVKGDLVVRVVQPSDEEAAAEDARHEGAPCPHDPITHTLLPHCSTRYTVLPYCAGNKAAYVYVCVCVCVCMFISK